MYDPVYELLLIGLFIVFLTAVAYSFSLYLQYIYSGSVTKTRFGRIEDWIYKITGTDKEREVSWWEYTKNLLLFNFLGVVLLFSILLLQGILPLNLQGFGSIDPMMAINIAASFTTNTNWQVYAGETTLSYFSQMAGLTVQNFLSAATGISVSLVIMRGFSRKETKNIGNFWVDMTRTILYVLLPIAFIGSILLVSQGVIQNFDPYIQTIGYGNSNGQFIPMGPVASQEAIKELGTNGGGFFNANAAHPFENPTPLSNLLEIFLILLIPASLPFLFGRMLQRPKEGFILYAVMLILFILACITLYWAEYSASSEFSPMGVTGVPMEGKEVRFGLGGSALYAVATTATSCGAVNTMHDSLSPLAGMVPMLLILLGETIFGGVGSGFYTMIGFVIIAVFIAGLMIGRTPEYLGKKISVFEMKMAIIAILTSGIIVLSFTALSITIPGGTQSMLNPGAHGFSELLYAFASMGNNNGSAFAGFDSSGFFYLISGTISMILGRYIPIITLIALAGAVAEKKTIASGLGTLRTDSVPFLIWLIMVISIIGVLTFFPYLSLGPLAEWFMLRGMA